LGLLIIIATWFVSRGLRAFSTILDNWHLDTDGIELDTTAIQALASIGVVLTWVLGIIVMLQTLGMNMNAVITLGGIGGAGIAFASKDVVANFFGGLLILFNRPFQVGDTIKSGSKVEGTVERIGLYATYLKTEDGNTLYVPNSIFNNSEILTVKN
jgi:MscS family membrane protein